MSIFNEINYNILKNKGSIITPVYISKSEFNKLEERPSFCESLDEMKSIDSNYIPVELKIINPYIIDYKKNMGLYESLFQNPSEEQINSLKNKGFDGLCLNMNGSKYYKVFDSKQVNPIVEDIQNDPVIENKIYQAVHDWTGSPSDYAFKELQEIYKYLPQSAKEYTGMLYRGITVNREVIEGLLNGKKYAFATQKKASSWTPKLELADRFSKTSIVLKTRITKSSQNRVFLNLDEIGYRQFDESEVILYGTGLTTNTISLKNIELINGKKVSEIIKNKEINSVLSDLDEVSKAEKYLQQLNKNSNGRFGMLVANYDWLVHSFINNDPALRKQLKFYRLSPSQKEILLKNAKFWADKILSYPNQKAILTAFERGDLGPSYGMYDIVTKHLEESYIPLNESKVDYILQNKKITELIAKKYLKDNNFAVLDFPEDKLQQAAETALRECEKLPYTNKYMIWLIKQYVQNKFKIPEDLSKLNSELERFSKISHKLEKTNINDYSWDEFLEVIPKLEDMHTSNEEKRIAKAGAEKLFENSNWIIIHPKTEEASCYYGKGTRWCTAAEENNYFDRYNRDGNLYIIISKTNPEEKYQIHFQSGSFMNAEDSPLDDREMNKIFNDKELLEFLSSLADKEGGLVKLPEDLENYNGGEFDVDISDLESIYRTANRDGVRFAFIQELLTDIPVSWYTESYSSDYVKYEFEYDTLPERILEVFISKGLNVGDYKAVYLDEIKKAYLPQSISELDTLEDVINKAKEETDATLIVDDIYISSTYNAALKDVLSQISEQLNMIVSQKEGTIVTMKPNSPERFKNAIRMYKLFGDSAIPYYETYIDTVIASIFAIYLDGDVISVTDPRYGWSEFDSDEFNNFIINVFCPKLESLVTEKDIKNIESEMNDFAEREGI